MSLGGRWEIKVGGATLRVAGDDCPYGQSGFAREPQMDSLGKVAGFTETPGESYIGEVEVFDGPDIDVAEILRTENENVVLLLANTKVFALAGAFQMLRHDGSAKTGRFKVKFVGTADKEVS
jgi:hypothetical protein